MALQNGLVNLCFQRLGVVGRRVDRSEEYGGPRQIALSLCDTRLSCEGGHVTRHDIENLVEFSQCFGETTKLNIQLCMLCEQGNVARVEPLGLVEIRLAPILLASSPRDRRQQRRNLAAIRQELTCLFKVTHRS